VTRFVRGPRGAAPVVHDRMRGHTRSARIRSPPVTSGPRARLAPVNAGKHRGRPGFQGPAPCRLCRTGMVRTLPGLEASRAAVRLPGEGRSTHDSARHNSPTGRARCRERA
jgi:hypothetical protein